MTQATPTSPRHQFDSLRNQLGEQEGLPFLKSLSRALVEEACRLCNHTWRERIYTPWITLGIFLSQILSDDHSCDDAISRFQKSTLLAEHHRNFTRPDVVVIRHSVVVCVARLVSTGTSFPPWPPVATTRSR